MKKILLLALACFFFTPFAQARGDTEKNQAVDQYQPSTLGQTSFELPCTFAQADLTLLVVEVPEKNFSTLTGESKDDLKLTTSRWPGGNSKARLCSGLKFFTTYYIEAQVCKVFWPGSDSKSHSCDSQTPGKATV